MNIDLTQLSEAQIEAISSGWEWSLTNEQLEGYAQQCGYARELASDDPKVRDDAKHQIMVVVANHVTG